MNIELARPVCPDGEASADRVPHTARSDSGTRRCKCGCRKRVEGRKRFHPDCYQRRRNAEARARRRGYREQAPICEREGCQKAVGRHFGREVTSLGLRIVHGIRWKHFCSRGCGAYVANLRCRERFVEALVQRIIADLKLVVVDDKVSMKDAARLVGAAFSKGKRHEANRLYLQRRRDSEKASAA
jgi:hypothetical protein